MSKIGWIKLYRRITDNKLWEDKPFARGQAWVDLLIMADSKDGECFYNGKIQPTHVGEVRTSILYLSKRWGWGNRKVKSFLDNLKKVGMIDFNCTSKCTTIFLVNYAKFAAKSNANAPQNAYQMHNTCTVDAQQMHTHKNIKNIKEDKENKEEKSLEIPCWLDVGNDYESLSAEDKKMRIICRKMDKLDELKHLAAEYGIPPDEADSLARECMEEHGANASWIDSCFEVN